MLTLLFLCFFLIDPLLVSVNFAISLFFPNLAMLKLFAVCHRQITWPYVTLLLFLIISLFGFILFCGIYIFIERKRVISQKIAFH